MKLSIAESAIHLSKQFGTDVEIEIPTETTPDDWIANTKMSSGHPDNLDLDTIIDVMLSDGTQSDCFYAADLVYLWNTTRQCHIVKYRVVK